MITLERKDNESELSYIWRLGEAKSNGELDMTWPEIADLLNRQLREPGEEMTESAYRKKYALMKQAKEDVFSKECADQVADEKIRELEQMIIKCRDERNDLNRIKREFYRSKNFCEQVAEIIKMHTKPEFSYDYVPTISHSDNDLLIPLTDIHGGLKIDSFFNEYNYDVLRRRLADYAVKIEQIAARHHSENAYAVISEIISGNIHTPLRIEANENVISQFLNTCDLITEFLTKIHSYFNELNVYCVPGNHSRILPKKEDNMKGENLDHLAIPYLEAKLQNTRNIHFFKNDIEESVAMFSVRNNSVFSIHGDLDKPEQVINNMVELFRIKPDIVLLGHRHTNGLITSGDVKVIQSGCLSGTDNYAISIRKRNKPEQAVAVINSNGIECIYDVKFD